MALIHINWAPTPREVRQFGTIWLPGFLALVGVWTLHKSGSMPVTLVLWGIASGVFVLARVRPGFIAPIFVSWMCLAYPVGWTILHLMFVAIFFLVVTPVGLAMRVLGHDPMERRFDGSMKTYWVARKSVTDISRYFRQY